MKYTEAIEKRNALVAEMEEVINSVKTEERKLSKVEDNEVIKLQKAIDELDVEITSKRNLENKNNSNTNKLNTNMNKNFNILKSIRDIVEGRAMSEETLAMNEIGATEFKKSNLDYRGQIQLPMEFRGDILASTGSGSGQEAIMEDKWSLMGALRNNSVLVKAGALYVGGLKGDVSIPVYAGSNVAWKTEVQAAAEGAGAFSEITLTAKRLTGYIDVSKSFLNQDSVQAEQMLMTDLNNAIIEKLESTILGATSGNTAQPAGIFYGATYTAALTGATSQAKVIGMEVAVETANALSGKLAYIVHPTVKGVMKSTAKGTSGIMILENGECNGYPVLSTNALPTVKSSYKATAFGNWNDLVIGSWSGVDILVDPYTQSINGKVRIVISAYFDAKPRRTASFSLNYLS